MKSKGERERYTQLNAKFQRKVRRDKTFFHEKCKEIEENSRKDKTRDLFKKIGNIKGKFHPKMGTINGRNGKKPNRSRKDQQEMQRRAVQTRC